MFVKGKTSLLNPIQLPLNISGNTQGFLKCLLQGFFPFRKPSSSLQYLFKNLKGFSRGKITLKKPLWFLQDTPKFPLCWTVGKVSAIESRINVPTSKDSSLLKIPRIPRLQTIWQGFCNRIENQRANIYLDWK